MTWLQDHWKHRPAAIGYVVLAAFIAIGFYALSENIASNRDLIRSNQKTLGEQIHHPTLYTVVQPVKVVSRVPGVQGPAIPASSRTVATEYDLCNTDKVPISVFATVSYTQLDSEDRVIGAFPDHPISNQYSVEAGCHHGRFDAPLPSESLPVGRYRQVTLVVASQPNGVRSDAHVVLSEIFQVVE